ncbi:uroporphyrinogen decarboxylase [Fulvivirgaceae bacterium BMA10]|uniref:Uroporphyrinogen decarboxylase n=1 Tax=Splendidivirga corallicola TaxID=3051826 RepID=A0ABT8KJV1_9BACT|nr:uroporphyrinogen decarboxylase [Fulvivirgaceae bacterium BMA10]
MQMKNDLLIRAARGEKTDRTPVWLMRQAGRILPEYRAVRSKLNGFIDLVKNPELAAEVTIQPVDILDVDAAIIFSDILVVPEAMGLPYEMIEKKGPIFPNTIQKEEDIDKLRVFDPKSELNYVLEAIKITKKELNGRVPLIGFAGAPWTIFSYMVEGSGSKTFSKARKMLYTQPALSHQLLQMITDSTVHYLRAQIASGADLVQIFDSWAGILSPEQYDEFALKYIDQICDAINEVPVTVFAKGAYFAREKMGGLNCETIGLDWNMDIEESRKLIGDSKTLQGNLDPCALYGSFKEIERSTKNMLDDFGTTRHIANLGHGVYPDVDPEKVKCFVQTVKEYSSK